MTTAVSTILMDTIFPEPREPASLTELQDWVHREIHTGRRAAVCISVLLAHARDAYFPDSPGEWLQWAMEEFGYEKRHCFRCLKAGRLLTNPEVPHAALAALAECETDKLEMLATLPSAQLPQFVKRVHPETLSRDELRAKVKLFQDPEEAVVCEQCGTEFVPKKDESICPACRKAGKQKKNRTVTPEAAFEKAVMAIQDAMDGGSPQVLDMCTHPASVRVGLKIVAMGLEHLRANNWWHPEQYDMIGGILADLTQTLDDVKTVVTAPTPREG